MCLAIMKLESQLARWQQAGLIDSATAARILAHEQTQPVRPYVLYAIGGLGALSIAIGVVSIVAANWGDIGPKQKLALDFLLLCGLALGIFLTDWRSQRDPESSTGLVREGLIFIFWGAILASIGLVGQIYQLGGTLHQALLFWSIITLPIVVFARTRFIFASWFIALQATVLATLQGYLHTFERSDELAHITAVATLPLLLIGVSLLPSLQRRRPELCVAAASLGIMEWLFAASLSQFVWYEPSRYEDVPHALAYAALPIGLSILLAFGIPSGRIDEKGRRGVQALLLYGPIFGFLPIVVAHQKAGLVGAAGFFVLWSLIGWTALQLGRVELFNLATAFLGLRLLGIYFELFGGLLNTGIGLLSGGVLTLLLAWLWVRLRRKKKPAAAIAEPPTAAPAEEKSEEKSDD